MNNPSSEPTTGELSTSAINGALGGRPATFNDVARGKVLALLAAGISRRIAASYAGVHHTTITQAAERDENFARELEQAEAAAETNPLMRIVAASQTNWRAAAWLVKNHRPQTDLRQQLDEEKFQARRADSKRAYQDALDMMSISPFKK